MAKKKKGIKIPTGKNSIIGLAVLVLALAVGVIVVNSRNLNPNSRAGILDPEGLDGEKFEEWAKEEKEKIEKEEKLKTEVGAGKSSGSANNAPTGGKGGGLSAPVPVNGVTAVADAVAAADTRKPSCGDDGICQAGERCDSGTGRVDCFVSSVRSDIPSLGLKAGDPLYYINDFQKDDEGNVIPGTGRTFMVSGKEGSSIIMDEFGRLTLDGEFVNTITGDVHDIYERTLGSGVDEVINAAQAMGFKEGWIIEIDNPAFRNAVINNEGAGVVYGGGGGCGPGGCPPTQGSTGNSVYDFIGNATYAVQTRLTKWLSSGVSDKNPVYKVIKSWQKD